MPAIQFPDFPPDLERIVLDGVELHYLSLGQGSPVVLVHGGGDDLRYWEAQLGPLAERYRLVTYSRRHSAPNNNPIASHDHSALIEADDLGKLIDALELRRVHLIGHSYGALTSLVHALRRPGQLRSLTLCEPPVLAWADQLADGPAVVREFMEKVWDPAGEAFRRGDPQAMQFLLDGIIGEGFFGSLPDELRQRIMGNARDLEALCSSRNAFPPLPLDAVRKLDLPVLLLTGARTTPINTIGLRVLERTLPRQQVRVIPEASHEVFVENPADSTAAVLAFLGGH